MGVKDNRNNDQDDTPSISMNFNKLKTRWRLFTQSILYLPVIFVVGAVLLFLLTSRLDELILSKNYIRYSLSNFIDICRQF